jgi:hypothetical protein
VLVQRRRHADDHRVHPLDLTRNRPSRETPPRCAFVIVSGAMRTMYDPPAFSALTFAGSMSNPVTLKAFIAEKKGQRQSYVAHADDADPRLARLHPSDCGALGVATGKAVHSVGLYRAFGLPAEQQRKGCAFIPPDTSSLRSAA